MLIPARFHQRHLLDSNSINVFIQSLNSSTLDLPRSIETNSQILLECTTFRSVIQAGDMERPISVLDLV